jgi:hypothetical protein
VRLPLLLAQQAWQVDDVGRNAPLQWAAECCVWRGNQPKGASALECHRASRRHIDRDKTDKLKPEERRFVPCQVLTRNRELAANCFQSAREAQTDDERVMYFTLAQTWLEVASRRDSGMPVCLPPAPQL